MQAVHMKKSISECDDESIVLRVDFSENTSLLTQNENSSENFAIVSDH